MGVVEVDANVLANWDHGKWIWWVGICMFAKVNLPSYICWCSTSSSATGTGKGTVPEVDDIQKLVYIGANPHTQTHDNHNAKKKVTGASDWGLASWAFVKVPIFVCQKISQKVLTQDHLPVLGDQTTCCPLLQCMDLAFTASNQPAVVLVIVAKKSMHDRILWIVVEMEITKNALTLDFIIQWEAHVIIVVIKILLYQEIWLVWGDAIWLEAGEEPPLLAYLAVALVISSGIIVMITTTVFVVCPSIPWMTIDTVGALFTVIKFCKVQISAKQMSCY